MAIAATEFAWAVACGLLPGCQSVTISSKSTSVPSASVPCTVGPANTLQLFASAAESWEIVSSSANDAAAGTGARAVLVSYLDANFEPKTSIVTLNGTTPVTLPNATDYFRLNLANVLSVGSDASKANLGTLTIRVAGAGATRGYISVGDGITRLGSYTVPAGHRLFLQNLTVACAKRGGAGITVVVAPYVRLSTGVIVIGTDVTYSEGVSEQNWPSGLRLLEKTTLEFRITDVSVDGIDIGVNLMGILTNLNQINWFDAAVGLR